MDKPDDAPDVKEEENLVKISDDLTLTLNAEDDENDGDGAEENKADDDNGHVAHVIRNASQSSTCVRIRGFRRSGKPEEDYAAWYKFFKEHAGVEVPLMQNPSPDDLWILFKFKCIEDKDKFLEHIKSNKFDGLKIRVKTVAFHDNYEPPERLPMSLEEGLDILYPRRNTLYSDQLKEKYVKVKSLVEDHLLPLSKVQKYCASKKYLKNIRPKEVIPFSPTEGYENNVLISVEKSSNGEVLYGLRAVDPSGLKNTIVPLEKCLSISRQTAIVAKAIVEGLSACGLEPFNIYTKEGELLGFTLRFSVQATFMLSVIVKKPSTLKFHELTENGLVPAEGEELGDTYKERYAKTVENNKNKITKFFENQGKALSISSVYLVLASEIVLLYQPTSIVWSNMPKPEFVVGAKRILEKINSVVFKVEWGKERHTEVLTSVLSLLEPINLNSSTTVFLLSPLKEIGYFFAKKCGTVKQIGFWPTESNYRSRTLALKDGIKNIDYLNFTSKITKPKDIQNSIVIWWPFLSSIINWNVTQRKLSILDRLMKFNIKSMVFISYWEKPSDKLSNNIEQHEIHMEKVYSKLKINKIIPFDLEPYKEGFGLFLSFNGFVKDTPPIEKFPKKKGPMIPTQVIPKKLFQPAGNRPFQHKGSMPSTRNPFQGNMDPWDRGEEMVRQVTIADRLGPRQAPPMENSLSEVDHVADVVENLQNMADQMQAFFKQSQQAQSQSNWPIKRKYPEDDFERRMTGEREVSWQERRDDVLMGRDYDDYEQETKRRRGPSMEIPIESTRSWGHSRNSQDDFVDSYVEPPSAWQNNKTASPSWATRESRDIFQTGPERDSPVRWRDNSSGWRDDRRNPSSWQDEGRDPLGWRDERRDTSGRDDRRNSSGWTDEGRNPSGWRDDGRNPASWQDERRNSSGWRDDGRNSSGWKDEGWHSSGWKDDRRNSSGWMDKELNSSNRREGARNPSGWKEEADKPTVWSNSSEFRNETGNSLGWRRDPGTSSDWRGKASNSSSRRNNDIRISPWESSVDPDWKRNNDPWRNSGKSSIRYEGRGNSSRGRTYY